jgi:hypothetical protein
VARYVVRRLNVNTDSPGGQFATDELEKARMTFERWKEHAEAGDEIELDDMVAGELVDSYTREKV